MVRGIYTREVILRNIPFMESKVVKYDKDFSKQEETENASETARIAEESESPMIVKLFEEVTKTKFESDEKCFYSKVEIIDDGVEQKYLIKIDKNPKVDAPIRAIVLIPSGKELIGYKDKANNFRCNVFRVENDSDYPGEVYVVTKRMSRIVSKYMQGEQLSLTDVKDYFQELVDWTAEMKSSIAKALSKNKRGNTNVKQREFVYDNGTCKRCENVYISDRAYASIVAEALSRDPLETGGILLGHYKGGNWYVVESTDPGLDTIHTVVHHEMDNKYHNHVYPVISRLYEKDSVLLGLWHRHPGELNTFSRDDNNTNTEYAKAVGNGAISILLNFVPEPRLTCYYLDGNGTKSYFKPKLFIGDKYFEGTDLLKIASEKTLMARKAQLQREIKAGTAV